MCIVATSLVGCGSRQQQIGDLGSVACADAEVASEMTDASGVEHAVNCGILLVPADHANPSSPPLQVIVARIPAAEPDRRIGSLMLNPGGPGLSGIDSLASWVSWLPPEILARFDLVTFDPRGTGRSGAVTCVESEEGEPLPDLTNDEGWASAGALLREQAAGCEVPGGVAMEDISTDATARDLDLLRIAVGDDNLTFVGWSYGARLGAHYARLFPDSVRAVVLDGPPAATTSLATVVEMQIAGFEMAFRDYANGCVERPGCASIDDVTELFQRVVDTARDEPIPSGRPSGDVPATWDVVERAVLGFLAVPDLWPYLDDALSEADRGDSGGLYDMIDSLEGRTTGETRADASDAAMVIRCNDAPRNEVTDATRREVADLTERYPLFGAYGSWWLLDCAYWDADRTPLPATPVDTSGRILVIATAGDPSTPYAGAEEFVRSLGEDALLLSWDGIGHTAFGRSACVNEVVEQYLVDLETPPAPARCEG